MKKELDIFFTAIMFFTRIPCPKHIGHAPDYINKSFRYFSLIGIVVGAISAAMYYLSTLLFPHGLAILLSMATSMLVTGAFHEDGLADVCDGFGGGWKKEDILRIMKDPRVGSFGVIGLLCVLSLKFYCLYIIPARWIPLILISGHAVSRFIASTLLYSLSYVRSDAETKVSTGGAVSLRSLSIAGIIGTIPLLGFGNGYVFIAFLPILFTRQYLCRYFRKWIGGYTGDCGGATQQISEIVFYLSMAALWSYIW